MQLQAEPTVPRFTVHRVRYRKGEGWFRVRYYVMPSYARRFAARMIERGYDVEMTAADGRVAFLPVEVDGATSK